MDVCGAIALGHLFLKHERLPLAVSSPLMRFITHEKEECRLVRSSAVA